MLKTIVSHIFNIISPPTCVACYASVPERIPLCDACQENLKPIVSCQMHITARYSMKVFAVAEYEGTLRSLIIAKQAGHRLASKQLGHLMAMRCLCDWKQSDFLIPIPLHWMRYASRGFNQSEEIAHVLSQEHNIPVSYGVKRIKATKYQASLEYEGRQKNVANVFEITPAERNLYRDKHIIIVDDVMTTGATLQALARVLVSCKPASITAVVAARVLLK